jgi:hypothetical protein
MFEIRPGLFIPAQVEPLRINLSGEIGKQDLLFDYKTIDGKEHRVMVWEKDGHDPVDSLNRLKSFLSIESDQPKSLLSNKRQKLVIPAFIKEAALTITHGKRIGIEVASL